MRFLQVVSIVHCQSLLAVGTIIHYQLKPVLTPFQLFHVGHMEGEDSSASDDNEALPPLAADHVQVPKIGFLPCSQLMSQIEQLVQQNSQTDGCTLYRQVATAAGVHLTAHCTQCVCE